MIENKFVLIRKIAQHGNQAVIYIPKILEHKIEPGMVAQITIEVLENKTN